MYDRTSLDILNYHQSMLVDDQRTGAYLRAIMHTVQSGDVVLDIGAGTGILAMLACLAGARRVYAIEQGPVVEVARQVAHQNGYGDRIDFIQDWSTEVELDEPVDVLVTETIGNIGFDEGILGWVIDAKKRLLTPGGRIIPEMVEMIAVPVESHQDYRWVGDWRNDLVSFDYSAARLMAAHNLHWNDLSEATFLSDPESLVQVDLSTNQNENIRGEVTFVINQKGKVYGIGSWFSARLIPGITLSNSPPNHTPSWTHGFLPLEQPLSVEFGDQLKILIQTQANSTHWEWRVQHLPLQESEPDASSKDPIKYQTTQIGQFLPALDDQNGKLIPKRSTLANADLEILQLMDGELCIDEIAKQLTERYPNIYTSLEHAQARVDEVCLYYGCNQAAPKKHISLSEV